MAGTDILNAAPDLCKVSHENATLLGSPIGLSHSINVAITDKVNALKTMGSRLCHLSKHDVLLLRHSFAIPKILYMLRTAPCFSSSCLETYDQELRSILSEVLNISLLSEYAWSQATLPVSYGGIGIRSAVQQAPSAFFASAAGSSDLIHCILPGRLDDKPYPAVDDAKIEWSRGDDQPPPPHPADMCQKAWDIPHVQETYDTLLEGASDPRPRVRLLAVATKESDTWLKALPIS